MKKIFGLCAFAICFSATAFADISLPRTPVPTPKGNQVELVVNVTTEVTEPTLVIKKSSSKLLRAALDEAEDLDENSALASVEKSGSTVSVQIILSGLFLTLGFIFAGVWLARSKPSKTIIGLFLFGIFGAGSVLVFANIAPPRIFGINKNMLAEELRSRAFARGKVRVRVVKDSDRSGPDIQLLIPMDPENNLVPNTEE